MMELVKSPFEFLRSFKECSEETEKLVLAILRKKFPDLTKGQLTEIFEKGVAGQFGKVYSLDPQTILGWVEKNETAKNSSKNYLQAPLLEIWKNENEDIEWDKETNKCYRAFLNGVSHENFHHAVYDFMMLDNKIDLGACYKYFKGPIDIITDGERIGFLTNETREAINTAKRKVIRDTFQKFKDMGKTEIFYVS